MGLLNLASDAPVGLVEAQTLLEASGEAVLLLDAYGRIHSMASSLPEPLRSVLQPGLQFANLFSGAAAAQVQHSLERALEGTSTTVYAPFSFESKLHLEWHFQTVAWGGLRLVLTVGRDISHHRTIQERLLRQATHDPLTGLPNRVLLEDRMRLAIAGAERSNVGFALAALDLDGFKKVNDALGHGVGDELLKQAAQRMLGALRQQDTLARMGGDEFIALLPGIDAPEDARRAGDRLIQAMSTPFQLLDHQLNVGTSVGIALYPLHATLDHRLLSAADQALYRAKDAGKGVVRLYDAVPQELATPRMSLEAALFGAVRNNELSLVYQSITSRDGQAVGVEALMRWHHPELGAVSPAQFIPLAEACGLVQLIGAWALRRACLDIVELRRSAGRDLYVAVNVSPKQLRSQGFVGVVLEALGTSGLPANRLQLEITENCLITDPDASSQMLNELTSRGVRIAVDDFGTGYSSLAYLRRFSLSSLKIDKSFVDGLGQPEKGQDLCMAILAMSRELGLATVAEGVETQDQLTALVNAGCERFQGFYFGRPARLEDLLAEWARVS